MKLLSGKRVGQSGQELAEAVFFSFFLHVIILLAATFLFLNVTPRTYVPPFYEVKLVGPSPETALPAAPSAAGQPALPKPEAKPAPKAKKAPPKARKAPPKKGVMPELAAPKQKPALEEAKPSEAPQEASKPSPGAAQQGAKAEGVEVQSQQDFKFGWYLSIVSERIGQNWRPPPDASDARAKVVFTINRSGRLVGEVNLVEESSKGTYGFKLAATRAIRLSEPFPALPEEFPQRTLELSVDLAPKD